MKHLVSFVQYQGVLDAYEDTQDLQQSLQALSMDGIELVPCDEDKNGIVQPEMVVGVHLPVYAAWMDFYHGNVERSGCQPIHLEGNPVQVQQRADSFIGFEAASWYAEATPT